MSDRSTSKVAGNSDAVAENSVTAVNGAISTSLKSSSLFGWLFAGTDLFTKKLDEAADLVSKTIDDTQESFQSMQAKGLEVETELKRVINPFTLADSAQKLVTSSPLYTFLSGGQKRVQQEKQLDVLSTKIDLLVEQVALLAAKKAAAEKVTAKKSTTVKAPTKAKSQTSTSTAKSAQKSEDVKTSTTKTTPSRTSKAKAETVKTSPATTTKARTTKASTTRATTSKTKAPPKAASSAEKSATTAAKQTTARRTSSKQNKTATSATNKSEDSASDNTLGKPSDDGTENS